MIILGGGLAGALCGIINPQAKILEGAPSPEEMRKHKAVLRFRDPKIGQVTGIDFKEITVYKAIWFEGREISKCEPRFGNLYSKKVTGRVLRRSSWELDTVKRWVAPDDFHDRLLTILDGRVQYGQKVESIDKNVIISSGKTIDREGRPVISTLPMPVLMKAVKTNLVIPKFDSQQINVTRYRVKSANVHQTIYYPDPSISAYRASIVGDLLIIEKTLDGEDNDTEVLESFGLSRADVEHLEDTTQLGKISPIDEQVRKSFIFQATSQYGVFSLGRFSIWKNILMDDVYDDIYTIRKFTDSQFTEYDLHRAIHVVGAR